MRLSTKFCAGDGKPMSDSTVRVELLLRLCLTLLSKDIPEHRCVRLYSLVGLVQAEVLVK